MKRISVFEGHQLLHSPPAAIPATAAFVFRGKTPEGHSTEIALTDDLLSKHILFLGGIGTGKTNSIFQLVAQLRRSMTENDVMLIFDTKGDYYRTFYRAGDIVISNDDTATGPKGRDYWNIFSEIERGQTMDETITEISRTLFYEQTHQSSQPFFPNAARDIFTGILQHFCRDTMYSDMNNGLLRSFYDTSTVDEIRAVLAEHVDLQAMASYIRENDSPQTQGVLSELQQLVREIFVGNFNRRGTLSVRRAVREKLGRAIFIEYDLSVGNLLTPIYRLLLDMAIKEALGRKKTEGNVWFIVDEFRLIPHLQHVDNGVNFGRSLGAKFIIGVQNVQQVFEAYGEALARSILSGFMTTVAFRVNDFTTRTFVQQLFGRNRKLDVYTSAVAARGIIENVREANVVEDWDIDGLAVGEAIVRLPGQEPFRFRFRRFGD